MLTHQQYYSSVIHLISAQLHQHILSPFIKGSCHAIPSLTTSLLLVALCRPKVSLSCVADSL